MPNTQSAKKALRQNATRRTKNVSNMRTLKKAVKEYRIEPTAEGLSLAYKKLDKAAKTNLIKKNKAARLKSRLAKRMAAQTK